MESPVMQFYNARPPRRGDGFQLAVDSTARSYLLTGLTFGGRKYDKGHLGQGIFLTLCADGGDIYFRFRSDSGSADMNETTTIAAGGTLSLQNEYCQKLGSGTYADLRIDLNVDQYLEVKTATSTATIRVNISSEPHV